MLEPTTMEHQEQHHHRPHQPPGERPGATTTNEDRRMASALQIVPNARHIMANVLAHSVEEA